MNSESRAVPQCSSCGALRRSVRASGAGERVSDPGNRRGSSCRRVIGAPLQTQPNILPTLRRVRAHTRAYPGGGVSASTSSHGELRESRRAPAVTASSGTSSHGEHPSPTLAPARPARAAAPAGGRNHPCNLRPADFSHRRIPSAFASLVHTRGHSGRKAADSAVKACGRNSQANLRRSGPESGPPWPAGHGLPARPGPGHSTRLGGAFQMWLHVYTGQAGLNPQTRLRQTCSHAHRT